MKRVEKTFNIITEIFIALVVILFPLIVDSTGFYSILECKWNAYSYIMVFYIASIIVLYFYFLIFKHINVLKGKKISKIQIFAILFLVANIISTILSPFKDGDLLLGVGRMEGLITITFYVITFLLISIFGKFNKRQILYFSISGLLVSGVCLLQYTGFNPFNMYKESFGMHDITYIGTIGNIDHMSALFTILLTVSFLGYIFLDNKKYENVIYLLSIILGFFIFEAIDVLSGKVAFLCTLALVLPFIIFSMKRLHKFFIGMSSVIFVTILNIIINPSYNKVGKVIYKFSFNYIALILIIVMAIFIILALVLKNNNKDYTNKKVIIRYYILLLILSVIGIIVLYFLPIGKGFLYELHNILHGNFVDEYGTYRIFLWKRTLKIFPEYPVFGSGPDTFVIRFMRKFTKDIAALGTLSVNDTAANVYLTMLINLGIVGLVSYLIFICSLIIKGLKKLDSTSIVLLGTIVCFLIQDFFNLWVVIIIPIYFALLGVYYNCIKDK